MSKLPYDALLILSFGGPDKPDDVMPFLENVTRGRGIPRERLESVAEHYYHFGGKSPINEQNLALIAALRAELARQGLELPVYFGNRNWHPLLPDTLRQMAGDGVKKALGFFTSAFSSYSGCRQYRENIIEARSQVGEAAPEVDKLRAFWNHPGFLEPMADSMREVYAGLSPEHTAVLFTAHSIPTSMAEGCRYEQQLEEACRIVADRACVANYELDYQSRSGSPHVPWLEPDVCDRIRELAGQGKTDMVVLPIGFISDHMEVLYDLDTEALELCQELGVRLHRLPTVGTHPQFVAMIVELIKERCGLQSERRALGSSGPSHDICPANCCLARRPR
ncbi:MAG: ferrochelatase [Candidatus Eremiobacteraeota bacterium]|nr:ferrochelatase [Candidatus Eremiobacteraeota bacterium]MCW5869829.1 ferrochelatase [Candidatus Eremiobacteraeota bacterium]